MIKDIKYQGHNETLSEYDCDDGLLALSLNLLHEDGQLKPIMPHRKIGINIGTGGRLLCVHNVDQSVHYIVLSNGVDLVWYDGDATDNLINSNFPVDTEILEASAVGNIVVLLTSKGVFNLIWKDNGYICLSSQLPECRISFGLKGEIRRKYYDPFTFTYDSTKPNYTPDADGVLAINNNVLSKVNSLLAEINDDGRFSMPFFVRYAYRLFDGTLTCHSAPILMIPTNVGTPIVATFLSKLTEPPRTLTCTGYIFSPACKLDAEFVLDNDDRKKLKDYSDIIKSIDIFISQPFYTYDQNGDCKEFSEGLLKDKSYGVFALDGIDDKYPDKPDILASLKKYSRRGIVDTISAATGFRWDIRLNLPERDRQTVVDEMTGCSTYYLVKSIPIDEIPTGRNTIEIGKDIINTLRVREVMTDDYDSHNKMYADKSFAYNDRLLLHGIRSGLFEGYFNVPFSNTYLSMYQFKTGGGNSAIYDGHFVDSVSEAETFKVESVVTTIKRGGSVYSKVFYPKSMDGEGVLLGYMSISSPLLRMQYPSVEFAYHPDNSATKMKLYGSYGNKTWQYSLDLRPHDFLNGAYYSELDMSKHIFIPVVNDFSQIQLSSTQLASQRMDINGDVLVDDDRDTWSVRLPHGNFSFVYSMPTPSDGVVSLPNRLYVSEVGNPFNFPVSSIVSVGSGSIIGVSTAAQALSQGQFGSFPLYAFCTDGIWSLSTNQTGGYSAVQPISRDVCNNADSITQLDGSVAFSTDRGIMQVAGASVKCISDAVSSENPFDVMLLPKINELHYSVVNAMSIVPFREYAQSCKMVYDYSHARLIVFNPLYAYCYVLSLKSGSWGMSTAMFSDAINIYTDAIAVDNDGELLSVYDDDMEDEVDCLYVTRPLKLGDGDVLKSVRCVMQRGYFERPTAKSGIYRPGDVSTVLYASRDLHSWYMVGSSKSCDLKMLGSPYKYYRIVGKAKLSYGKSINGSTVEFVYRENKKIH